MNRWIFDIESYPNFFSCVFKHVETGQRMIFEVSDRYDQAAAFYEFIYELSVDKATMVGYNNIGYDYPVIHHVMQVGTEFKALNAYEKTYEIIHGARGLPSLWPSDYLVPQIDLFKLHHFDNFARSTNLKVLEFNMRSANIGELPHTSGTALHGLPWGNVKLVVHAQAFHPQTIDLELVDGQIVTQDVILFNDTVARNIAYGTADADPDQLRRAAQAAHALTFIEALPNGFDTVIGPRGVKLSGGQRQRLAIARAIYRDPPILIFDEATSALDTESEFAVQQAIQNLLRDRTALIVAHRLSTVRHADQIVVIDNGQVVDTGTHEALMARDGLYRRLHDLQFADKSPTGRGEHESRLVL